MEEYNDADRLAPRLLAVLSMMAMAQRSVREVDDVLVKRLRIRAAPKERSIEAEHPAILQQALRGESPRRGFEDLLLAMPGAGEDADFERCRSPHSS